jgi:HK97 family phage portal protein
MNPLRRVLLGLKAFAMTFGGQARYWWSQVPRSQYDYAREVGDGSRNSIVAACVLWICRTFPEAPVRVSTVNAAGEDSPIDNHPLKLLLDTPNPYYPGELLWSATLADRTITGNAYWLKVRSGQGRVVELWWVPSTMMEPKWPDDGSAFISHYEYTPGSRAIRVDPRDVVHFRYQMFDPNNIRKGLSPIQSLLREIFTDDEAANYTAAMLRNVGVPPVVISPGPDASPSEEELQQTKQRYQEVTTGDARGQALIMSGPTTVTTLGFNPQQMDVANLRNVPEERISAILGIPAAVVGLGTGLENTKVGATMAEMREQAYESNIIPTQRLMAAELRSQLLVDFGDVSRLTLDFDLGQVRVLQADQNELHERARRSLLAGGITLNEFREMVGLKPLTGAEGDAFYIPSVVSPMAQTELLVPAAPPAQALPALPPGQPSKVLILPARARESKAANLGEPLNLTQAEIDQLAEIGPDDLEAARLLWVDEAPDDLEDLLDAREVGG